VGVWDKLKSLFGGPATTKSPSNGDGDQPANPTPAAPAAPAAAAQPRAKRPSNRTWTLTKRGRGLALIAPHGTFPIKGLADEDLEEDVAALPQGAEVVCEGDYVGGASISELVVTRIVSAKAPTPRPSPTQPVARSTGSAMTAGGATASVPLAPQSSDADRFFANEILGLSAAEVRKRILRTNPFRTPWFGRSDTIPPSSDELTMLIDRGLILRGFLTKDQLDEIHRVGDIWVRHHDAKTLATSIANQASSAAVAAEKARKAAVKAEKKKQAALREAARQIAIRDRRENDIVFAGRGVSARLHDRTANVEALTKLGLPVLATPKDVATALAITVPQLRWLCFHKEAAEKTHYVYFEVPKRSGGTRLLAAPHRKLAAAQQWVLANILARLEVTPQAHGFVPGRSTVTNAKPHIGKHVVVNLDLKDFFPTIIFPRVRGLFESLGYSPAVATLLALLCTESPRTPVVHDGRTYWVAAGDRALPQGACTSPTLSNLVSRKLDRRLAGSSRSLGWTYTRYADDLTFSGTVEANAKLGLLFARVRHIVAEEGFVVNEKKGRVARQARRQSVTGVVVNEKLGVPREEIRRMRAILHGAKKTGLSAQNRQNRPNFDEYVRGKIAYIAMIDAAKGAALKRSYDQLTAK
jgi:RNA-directed DNA polymerase